jgi:hypothetical protein
MEPAAAEGPLYELSTMLDHLPALRYMPLADSVLQVDYGIWLGRQERKELMSAMIYQTVEKSEYLSSGFWRFSAPPMN